MSKLTKAQRAQLLTETDRFTLSALDDEKLLAVHDFIHEEIIRRCAAPPSGEREG